MSKTNRTKPRGQHRLGRPGLVAADVILDEHRKLRLVTADELGREQLVAEIQEDSDAAMRAVEAKQRAMWGTPAGWNPHTERIADWTIPYVLADVREARRQHGRLPGTVKASLGDYELVYEQLKLKVANGTPGTADYVFASDLLACIGPVE